jgi:predicted acetyltransferase
MIKISRYSSLDTEMKAALEKMAHNEFGHIPVVKETKWAMPDWSIIDYTDVHEIATFYNIVERKILFDRKEVKAAGINNVITNPAFRKQGLATRLLVSTKDFIFDELQCETGMLLCADSLIPFYHKLQWYKTDATVLFDQPDVKGKVWPANAMLLNNKNEKVNPKEINLNGLPW